MESLRVCLVSYEFPPFGGGEGVYTYDLMKMLQSRGSEIVLITPDWSKPRTKHLDRNRSIIRVNPLLFPGLKTTSFMIRANQKLKALSKSFDIVHYTNDYCGFGLSRTQIGKPVIATLHHTHSHESASVNPYLKGGLLESLRYSISQRILTKMEGSTMQNADTILAVSKFTAENAANVYPVLKNRIRVVLNGIDETRFRPDVDGAEYRDRLGLRYEPIVLYVGRLAASKGIEFLIKSFKRVVKSIPDAKLLVVGSGVTREERNVRSEINNLGLNSSVIMVGRVSDDDLPKVYAASDVVVLPSLVEGFGLVLLEAMATSKPVVATDVGPTSEIVSDGIDGMLIPKADDQALAERVISLLSDKSLAIKMGKQGRKTVEDKFTTKRWASQMFRIYEGLLVS